ncbi:MAG: hypothetical protein WA254_06580 [Candidatus Sulfotelmatobacter sp.]
MSKPTLTFCLLLLAVSSVAQQQETKDEPEFPKTEEIQLVVTQAERALEQYKQSVTMEAELPSARRDQSAVKKDQEVFDETAKLIAALKMHPEAFHGLGGLLLLSSLDDASRNAALCSGAAYNDSMQAVMTSSDAHSARDWLHVGLSCVDVSGYLYTVSESVQALLVRDLKAQQILNQEAAELANKCNALMKSTPPKKQ